MKLGQVFTRYALRHGVDRDAELADLVGGPPSGGSGAHCTLDMNNGEWLRTENAGVGFVDTFDEVGAPPTGDILAPRVVSPGVYDGVTVKVPGTVIVICRANPYANDVKGNEAMQVYSWGFDADDNPVAFTPGDDWPLIRAGTSQTAAHLAGATHAYTSVMQVDQECTVRLGIGWKQMDETKANADGVTPITFFPLFDVFWLPITSPERVFA